MRDWLIILTVAVVLWALWLFMNFVANLFERYHGLHDQGDQSRPESRK